MILLVSLPYLAWPDLYEYIYAQIETKLAILQVIFQATKILFNYQICPCQNFCFACYAICQLVEFLTDEKIFVFWY